VDWEVDESRDGASEQELRARIDVPSDPEAAQSAARVRAQLDARRDARRRRYMEVQFRLPDRAA